jgi:spermidine synthase
MAGFLSLSQEILWIRLVSFAHQSVPQSFAFVLGLYLIGIALGALAGKRLCQQPGRDLFFTCGLLFCAAMLFDFLAPFVFVWSSSTLFGIAASQLLIMGSAGIRSVVFPIVHHIGSQTKQNTGASISNVYFANVFGATLGPIVTGFFLLDHAGTQQAFIIVSALTGMTGFYCFAVSERFSVLARWLTRALTTFAVVAVALCIPLPDVLIKELVTMRDADGGVTQSPNYIHETRSGIIHTYPSDHGDIVFGGNVYDGVVNTDLRHNDNKINRAYLIPVLAPDIKNILIIGLSSGSWARVVSSIPTVRRIDIVEINPGYIDLIKRHAEVTPLLDDPRVHIHIDDGRRWLNRARGATFDFILMNTTWHWRSYATNLLSADFLQLVRPHLNPGGSIYFNTTGSNDIFYTARQVFPHAYRYSNFVIASDVDMAPRLTQAELIKQLARLQWPETGQALFDMNNPADLKTIHHILDLPLVTLEAYQRDAGRPFELVTDQNMLTEYKYGRGL